MEGLLDYVLVHTAQPLDRPKTQDTVGVCAHDALGQADEAPAALGDTVRPVRVTYHDIQAIRSVGPVVVARDLADPEHPTWHAPAALRDAFLQVLGLVQSRRAL